MQEKEKEEEITAETANEKEFVTVDENRPVLILFDNGFQSLKLFAKIDKNGSYFITKARHNCAAVIAKSGVTGIRLLEVMFLLRKVMNEGKRCN